MDVPTLAYLRAGTFLDMESAGRLLDEYSRGKVSGPPAPVSDDGMRTRPPPAVAVRSQFRRFLAAADAGEWVDAVWVVRNGARIPLIEELHYQRLIDCDALRAHRLPLLRRRLRGRLRLGTRVRAVPSRGRGLSWTTDLDVPRCFARRYAATARPGLVYAAEVPPEAVLGVFQGREEAELVVDPTLLRNLRTVERVGLAGTAVL